MFDTLWHSPVPMLDCPVVMYQRPADMKLFSTSAPRKMSKLKSVRLTLRLFLYQRVLALFV